MKGHKKKVLVVKAHKESPILLSGSADKTIGIWNRRKIVKIKNEKKFSIASKTFPFSFVVFITTLKFSIH